MRVRVEGVIIKSQNWYMRHHWSFRKKVLDQLARELFYQRVALGVKPADGPRKVTIRVVSTVKRRRDWENWTKVEMDSLCRSGWIVDDSPGWLIGMPVVVFETGPVPAIEFEIEEGAAGGPENHAASG